MYLLTLEYETTTLFQNISHQSYSAMAPHPRKVNWTALPQNPKKSHVAFCQEQCVGPFTANSKFAKTTLSVDNEYQT